MKNAIHNARAGVFPAALCTHALFFDIFKVKPMILLHKKERFYKRTNKNKDTLWEKDSWLLHMCAPGALDDNLSCL